MKKIKNETTQKKGGAKNPAELTPAELLALSYRRAKVIRYLQKINTTNQKNDVTRPRGVLKLKTFEETDAWIFKVTTGQKVKRKGKI